MIQCIISLFFSFLIFLEKLKGIIVLLVHVLDVTSSLFLRLFVPCRVFNTRLF